MKLVLVTPRVSEKSYRLVTKVAKVTTLVQNGKSIRYSRGKNRYPGTTSRQDSKKAYVTLSEGKIKVFEQEEVKEEK